MRRSACLPFVCVCLSFSLFLWTAEKVEGWLQIFVHLSMRTVRLSMRTDGRLRTRAPVHPCRPLTPHKHTHTYTYPHPHMHLRMHPHTHTCVCYSHACTRTTMHTHTHTHMNARACTNMPPREQINEERKVHKNKKTAQTAWTAARMPH